MMNMLFWPDMARWSDLTRDQQSEFGNACGPDFLPEIFTEAMFGWFHSASCRRHDFGYKRGGNNELRKIVDSGFYRSMKDDANELPWVKRILARSQAALFYRAVRMFGWSFFHYGTPRNLLEILEDE